MEHPFSRLYIQLFVAASLATTTLPIVQAEPRCPGNIAALSPRFVQRAFIVIPVRINHAGPFDFMVDTGSQITIVDPALAAELDLKPQDRVGLVSVANQAQASISVLDTLEAGSRMVEKPLAVVQDLRQIQAADPRIRGVLGVNFLAHFDLLIDYPRKLLCLDDAKAMREQIHGERVPLVTSQRHENELPFTERLVIAVHLSDAGSRQILLQLDSGSDGPILYPHSKRPKLKILERAALQGGNVSKAQQAFAVLPPQDMRIGARTLSRVSFVTPVSVDRDLPSPEEDGLLPTLLFQRVYISYADGLVVFDPR